jgi:hypothetical protein
MTTNQAAAKPMTSKRVVVLQVAAALALSAYCLLHYAWLTESPPEQKWTDSASLMGSRRIRRVIMAMVIIILRKVKCIFYWCIFYSNSVP